MEGNRDEAEKCIEIAREALEAANRERALRFLHKAQKLYPTETARGEARTPSPADRPATPLLGPRPTAARLPPPGAATPSPGRKPRLALLGLGGL